MSLFKMGELYLTAGVNNRISEEVRFKIFVKDCIEKHLSGEWGELGKEDKKENELSLKKGFRLLSSYKCNAEKIWIITEADRSSTTVLFPDEY